MDNSNFLKDEKENTREILTEGHKNESKIGFILGFLITLLTYVAMFFSFEYYAGYEGSIRAFLLAILFMIIGIILWAIIRFQYKKRFLALGFLIGGISTFLAVFILPKSP